MNMLLIFLCFIIVFIIVLCYERKIRNISVKSKNKVHFYVARDEDEDLWLYIGKPVRTIDEFIACNYGKAIVLPKYFSKYGLNENDYDNLTWEDEPVEVFLNMKD